MRHKFGMLLMMGLGLASSSAWADTAVYDNMTGHTLYRGYGAFSIYDGMSPTFEFIPSGVTPGDLLSHFVVPIGNALMTGVHHFDLTLYQQNTQNLTTLGSWIGQTDGVYNGQNNVSVDTTPISLVNGNHYYLQASVRPGEGLNGNTAGRLLDWGYVNDVTGPVQKGLQVFVSSAVTSIPEPAFYQMGGLLALGGIGMLRLRRKRNEASDLG